MFSELRNDTDSFNTDQSVNDDDVGSERNALSSSENHHLNTAEYQTNTSGVNSLMDSLKVAYGTNEMEQTICDADDFDDLESVTNVAQLYRNPQFSNTG